MILPAVISFAMAANVTVDVSADRRGISPGIYGVTFGSQAQVSRMGVTLRRFGGNAYSRYNYTNGATNEGGDGRWFRNLVLDGGLDEFLAVSRSTSTDMVVELPLLGFVGKPGSATSPPWTCGCSVAKYGAQQSVAPDDPDCGNCVLLDGGRVSGIDPFDTSVAIDAGFLRGYVDHLLDAGVRYFELGNQPALWSSTHADIHPQPSTYAEITARLAEAAAVAKAANPQARTLGPSEWGWINYFDSAAGERAASGIDFVPYYLREARRLEMVAGARQLDYLDLHVYPMAQSPDVGLITRGDTTPAASALRLRSTRILWDPAYTVESWEICCFDTVLKIIPRMRDWVDAGYPGTQLSISGYNWGALDHISGALAQVDVLGIFGREGVALAMLEAPIPDGAIGEDAFKLYRDFDGTGARFGSTSVRAASDDLRVAAFASVEGDRVLVVLINKDAALPQPVDVTLPGVPQSGSFRSFAFNASQRLAASGLGSFNSGRVMRTLPAWSAEVLELAPIGWDGGFTIPDAGVDGGVDAGAPDAGVPDAGPPDAGPPDAGAADSGVPDSGVPDSGTADAGRVDAGTPDAGGGGGTGGCGCGTGGAPLLLLAGAMLRRLRRRR